MATNDFQTDIENCLAVLRKDGVILFPTDTIWGLGCDATNEKAVAKVLQIKQRSQAQGLITLLANENDLQKYVNVPDNQISEFVGQQHKPTTIIYEGGKNVAANILPDDGTLAIRLVKDAFCKALINQFGKPIVSTSANVHGHPSPQHFGEIDNSVKEQVDYIVQHRQQERDISAPSAILRIRPDGSFETIRP